MKRQFLFLSLAAMVAVLVGCSKEDTAMPEGSNAPQGKFVSVTLPVQLAEVATTPPPAMSHTAQGFPAATGTGADATPQATSRATAAAEMSEGFSVSFGEPTTAAAEMSEGFSVSFGEPTAAAASTEETTATSAPAGGATAVNTPATRAVSRALTNVWVLQFDDAGKNIATSKIGTIAAGAPFIPTLQAGTRCTIYVVANGPASGLSTSKPATLADFESRMLATAVTADAAQLPLAGKLTGATVVDLGGGKGTIRLEDTSATISLSRIHAEVTLVVDCQVTNYSLTGAQLYNVPKGAAYGWNSATTTFPGADAANFNYRSTTAAGLTPLTTTSSYSKTTYRWVIGDNRRGEEPGLLAFPDRHTIGAPAYSTFARITLTNDFSASKKIFFDVFFGSGDITNFDVMRNQTYTLNAAIKGKANFIETLSKVDGRVSSTGGIDYDWDLSLTELAADSPILISPKRYEGINLYWGPSSTFLGATHEYNGHWNTDAVISASVSTGDEYPAVSHCRSTQNLGSRYYLPARRELLLLWAYYDAIPPDERPATDDEYWSSTEVAVMGMSVWRMDFSNGYQVQTDANYAKCYIRCFRMP